jgi:uncharacterized protein YbaR (Trm112 family)
VVSSRNCVVFFGSGFLRLVYPMFLWIVHSLLSIRYCPFFIVHSLLSILYCPFFIVHSLLSILYCPFFIVHSLLSILYCPFCILYRLFIEEKKMGHQKRNQTKYLPKFRLHCQRTLEIS